MEEIIKFLIIFGFVWGITGWLYMIAYLMQLYKNRKNKEN